MNPANVGGTHVLQSRRVCELVVAEVKPCLLAALSSVGVLPAEIGRAPFELYTTNYENESRQRVGEKYVPEKKTCLVFSLKIAGNHNT